jgi:hypothetical protein
LNRQTLPLSERHWWEGSLTTVVGFRIAFDSEKNRTLVRAAAYILCGTVRVKSIVCVQRVFRRKFGHDRQRGAAPSRYVIGRWVRQWRETESVQVKARTGRNTVQSPENIQRVRKPWRGVHVDQRDGGDGSNGLIVMENISKTY